MPSPTGPAPINAITADRSDIVFVFTQRPTRSSWKKPTAEPTMVPVFRQLDLDVCWQLFSPDTGLGAVKQVLDRGLLTRMRFPPIINYSYPPGDSQNSTKPHR